MACSRMPKCSIRPYGLPGSILVCRSVGRKLGSPSGVVLLDSARSAEPPHSSGSFGAERVEHLARGGAGGDALGVGVPAGQAPPPSPGSARCRPSGRRGPSRPRWPSAQVSKPACHSAWAAAPRSRSFRVWARTSSSTSKVCSGSKPSISLVAATSSLPSALPCALPVFCFFGAGQPMIVRRLMKLGRSVTSRASSSASIRALTFSSYWVSSLVQSMLCTCQPYAS